MESSSLFVGSVEKNGMLPSGRISQNMIEGPEKQPFLPEANAF